MPPPLVDPEVELDPAPELPEITPVEVLVSDPEPEVGIPPTGTMVVPEEVVFDSALPLEIVPAPLLEETLVPTFPKAES